MLVLSSMTRATDRFLHLDEAKQLRILEAATTEFAQHGYERANTNRIAQAAGISVGALFKYFPTKQDIFAYVVDRAENLLESVISQQLNPSEVTSVLDGVDTMLRIVAESCITHRDATLMYLTLAGLNNEQFATETAIHLEDYPSQLYIELLEAGQAAGEIRSDIPAATLAFLTDNIFMSLQQALISDYYVARRTLYLGDQPVADLIAQTSAYLRAALAAPKG